MGLAPSTAQAGDIISVLFGSMHLVILRRRDDFYIVVGNAYAYGLMYGEAIVELWQGKYTVEEFELH